MIWELALNVAIGMKCTQYYYGIPTGTIAFWGTHVLRILPVDLPLYIVIIVFLAVSTSLL